MKRSWIVVAVVGVLALAACGGGSSTASSGSTIKITMRDNAYEPASVQVRKGEAVTFEFTNAGAVVHEAFIGDQAAQEAHAMEMSSSSSGGGMAGMDHGEPGMLTVNPGKTATTTYTFNAAGTFLIGCHQPLHYEQGMKITVTVT